jgi:hypothetical protein
MLPGTIEPGIRKIDTHWPGMTLTFLAQASNAVMNLSSDSPRRVR